MTHTRSLLCVLALALGTAAQAQDKVGTTAAPFLGIGLGARATAMGGAQVAEAQGASALYWNPAAIALTPGNKAEFTHADWFVGSAFQNAAIALDLGKNGHLGVSLLALDYGEELVTTIENPEGTGELWGASDLALGVSYARALTDRFAFGGTVKFVRQQIWNESASGAAMDLGVLYDTGFRGLKIGMSMTNFGTDMRLAGPDLRRGIDITPDENGNNPNLGSTLEVGSWAMPLMFRVGVSLDAFRMEGQQLRIGIDGAAPADDAQSTSLGAEYAFRNLFFARGGYRQALGSEGSGGWTAGFGLRYAINDRFAGTFDYAFQQYEPFGTPQMFSVGLAF